MSHWKSDIEPKLKARNFENQKIEAKIGGRVLNRMTEFGRAGIERTTELRVRLGAFLVDADLCNNAALSCGLLFLKASH